MISKIMRNNNDEAEKLLSKHGRWVVGAVETSLFWPTKNQIVNFDGKDFLLMPAEKKDGQPHQTSPAIALKTSDYNFDAEQGRKELMRFASALSWRERAKLEFVMWSGGSFPIRMITGIHSAIRDYLDGDHLPCPSDENAKSALAFYREGISLDNPFYSFLSFYKAFCVSISDKKSRKNWFSSKKALLNQDIMQRVVEIETSGVEIGMYLYEKCRHSIAHSDQEPYVNPDNTDDHFRLKNDVPVMKNFAEIAIEETFGIKRLSTIYKEHTYELQGFKEEISDNVITYLKSSGGISSDSIEIEIPDEYFVVARRGGEKYSLGSLKIVNGGIVEGGLLLDLATNTNGAVLRIILDFKEEKLKFNPITQMGINKDRSSKELLEAEMAALRFQRCILSNGRLEIWSTDGEKMYGCTEAFVPLNCMVNYEYFDKEITELEKALHGGDNGAGT